MSSSPVAYSWSENAFSISVLAAPAADDPPKEVLGADGRVQLRARRLLGPRPPRHRHGLLARRVAQRIAVRDEVEDMVGVEVADQHR